MGISMSFFFVCFKPDHKSILKREKAELWQKADELEYENQLKNSAMWIDDSTISNCMSCNSGFSLMLRKVRNSIK
jgi:hypothetical protein